MRFTSLTLERYGRFTDRLLEFDPEVPVTIVHGANETGKTTALAAVTDVLFGIEERSRFNFLHDYKTMRLSATVSNGQGLTLSFARLKRRNATLVDPVSGTVLGDNCLAPYLGAHDRPAFLDIFGLDQTRLRDGGRKLLAGGGDLANTLLAVAPGLSRVVSLRDRLKESAAKIFNPERRNSSNAFYRALDRRDQARRTVREQELRIDEVKALREEAEQAKEAREQAVRAEISTRFALSHGQMLGRGAKELRILDAQTAARDALGTLPSVPSGFTALARNALNALESSRRAVLLATEEEAGAEVALNAIVVDAAILALAEPIERCDEERIAVQRELGSLPNRRSEANLARGGLGRIAAGLGLPDVESLRERIPGTPLLARADKLVDRLRAADIRAEALEKDRARLATKRQETEEARAGLGHVTDPTPLKRRLAALDGAEERERALRLQDSRAVSAQRELAERAGRLGPDISGAEALATLPLPTLPAAETVLRAVKEADDTLARQTEAQNSLAEQLAQAQARFAKLNAGRPAPTEAAIGVAREHRDKLWALLRPLAQGERAAVDEDGAIALKFERAMGAADLLADERQTETARLADLAQAELTIVDLRVRLDAALKRVEDAASRVAEATRLWRSLWIGSGLTPAAGEQTLGFLREADAILQERQAIARDAADCESARAAVRWDREEVDKLRHELGLSLQGDAPLRMADLREAVADLENRFQKARDQERDLKRADQVAAEFADRERELADEQSVLTRETADIFPLLALRPQAPAEEARAALDLWREALALVPDLSTAEHRIAGIERDHAAFISRVSDSLHRMGENDGAADALAVAKQLRARLDAARQARSRADHAADALERRRKARGEALAELERRNAVLADILQTSNLASPDQLLPLLDRLDEASACAERMEQARARLADICGSRSEEELRASIAGRDDDALAMLMAEAEAQHETARSARDATVERDTQAKAALAEIERRVGAAAAAQEEQDAVAEVAEAIEHFTRDHVAARLLTVTIERYREKHQNPIVERASRAFAGLTCGRWSGVDIDYDQDPPRLAPVRDGRLHNLDALSEGTADQLFLAFRVAALEEHARRAPLLPFLADDLFVSFDETRTAAGLSLLGELGALTQVIVFTHHDHVAACAEQTLKQAATIIKL